MSCNFFGETSTIMPKRGETGNWVSPPLSVLCAHPRVAPLSHRFSPRTWSCRRCCPHIFSSFPRVHCPLSVAPGCFFPLLLGSRRLPRCPPPPLNRSNKPNTALLRKLPHRPNLLLLDWSRDDNHAADLSRQRNQARSYSLLYLCCLPKWTWSREFFFIDIRRGLS